MVGSFFFVMIRVFHRFAPLNKAYLSTFEAIGAKKEWSCKRERCGDVVRAVHPHSSSLFVVVFTWVTDFARFAIYITFRCISRVFSTL